MLVHGNKIFTLFRGNFGTTSSSFATLDPNLGDVTPYVMLTNDFNPSNEACLKYILKLFYGTLNRLMINHSF